MFLDKRTLGIDAKDDPSFEVSHDGEGVDPTIEGTFFVNLAMLCFRIKKRTNTSLSVLLKSNFGTGLRG